MIKKNIKIISIVLIIILILTTTTVLAVNPDSYIPSENPESGFISIGNKIASWIQVVGVLAGVIVLSAIGIKYMLCSIDEKAKYKETVIPYIVGALLLMGTTTLLKVIASIALD